MKVLMVVVSGGPDPIYREHKKAWVENRHPQVTSVFIEYTPDVEEIMLVDDTLLLPGVESFTGMTRKTIDSIEYLLQDTSFTHVIRTNLSSLWHYPRLLAYLSERPLNGLFEGVLGKSSNRPFVSGAGMYMSRDIAERLIALKEKACAYPQQDDVAISFALADDGIACGSTATRENLTSPMLFDAYVTHLHNAVPSIERHHYRLKQDSDRRVEPKLMMTLVDIFRQNEAKSYQ